MNSSPTPAKGEFALTPMVPSATAEPISAERTALSAQSDTADLELDEGIDYFSAQGALAAYRLGR